MKFKLSKDEKKAIPLLLPGLIVTSALVIYPLIYIIRMSFNANPIMGFEFAGISNYIVLFNNPQFTSAMVNTLKWTFSTVVFSFGIGFLLAAFIHHKSIKYKRFFRSMIFIAWIIPGVVKATTWKWMFTTDGGIINHMLETIGMISEPIPWLTNSNFAMFTLVIVQVWSCAPYVMLMMTAGLGQVSEDLYESASLEGINPIQKIWYITLPMLKDISFICILMLLVWAINEFSLIWIMTSGGQNTTTLSLLVYNQFKVLNLNMASASAIMQLVITMAFAIVYVKLVIKED